ncbi:M20/M25/M40 family metallo-hydrolase [Streptosporangium subroseum]|uniref:M20/M25/M40 family metallo-hydrolase n=1 Tax=Streptosporangium subroseum TaxID=106412 RepID=UPI00308B78F1|nr:M20/M25/M40 family metallo-hydrolase [Streptosporangium subroseum]
MNLNAMLEDLEELVVCESFSADHEAVARSAKVVADQGARLLGARPETIVIDGVTHLRWSFGAPRALLVGHHDTVWPIGTLTRIPWSLVDGIARGPGVFDMKAGLVQTFHALAALPSLDGVCVLVTGDEEVGSPSSRTLIEETARKCAAAFVLEAGADGGALKTSRKGISIYELAVHGRASHAGLDPEKGANAGIELAHQILAIAGIADRVNGDLPGMTTSEASPVAGARETGARETRAHEAGAQEAGTRETGARETRAREAGARETRTREAGARETRTREAGAREAGAREAEARGTGTSPGSLGATTVTPTALFGGTTVNTVPALARVSVDVRVPTLAAQERVDELIRALSPRLAGTRLEVSGGPNRPPLEEASSAALFAVAQRIAADLGLAPLTGVGVGGASDGNYTAGVGCPTLDGLGAVGGGAHADSEHVVVSEMPGRTALLTGLVQAVLR